jgi:hypothetical protein
MEKKMNDDMDTTTIPLGRVVATPGALLALKESHEGYVGYLARHAGRDYGDIRPEDWEENEFSPLRDLRILSGYTLRNGSQIYIITEADRSVTTILLATEY